MSILFCYDKIISNRLYFIILKEFSTDFDIILLYSNDCTTYNKNILGVYSEMLKNMHRYKSWSGRDPKRGKTRYATDTDECQRFDLRQWEIDVSGCLYEDLAQAYFMTQGKDGPIVSSKS